MTRIDLGDSIDKIESEELEGKESEVDESEEDEETKEEEGTPANSDADTDPDDESEKAEEPKTEEVADTPEEGVEKKLQPIEDLEKTKEKLEAEVAELASDPAREDLLKDIQELRAARRVLKGSPFTAKKQEPVFVKKDEEDPLKDIAPEDVSTIEKVLKAKGYVQKSELEREQSVKTYKQQMDEVTNTWLQENSEFGEEKDPDGKNWQKIHDYISDNFDAPKNPKAAKDLLDIARDRLFGKKNATLPEKSPHSIAAKKEKIAVSSAKSSSGGTNVSGTPTKADYAKRAMYKGFTEEDFVEMGI